MKIFRFIDEKFTTFSIKNLLTKKSALFAFTLAETLMVMGIIGIIAVLTIPNLSQSTNELENITKLQKIYANLNEGYTNAIMKYDYISKWPPSSGSQTTNVRFHERMLDFIKVSNDCGNASNSECFKSGKVKTLSGGEGTNYNSTTYPKAILADGSSVVWWIDSINCTINYGAADLKNVCGTLVVDINGPIKGSYTQGKDVFTFFITSSGIFPSGSQLDYDTNTDDKLKTNCFTSGLYCAGWVIQNNSMDYLKGASGTCPNTRVLNWTVTSCK